MNKTKVVIVILAIIVLSLTMAIMPGCKTGTVTETTAGATTTTSAETTASITETTTSASETTAIDTKLKGKKIGFLLAGPDDWYKKCVDTFTLLGKDLDWEVATLASDYKPDVELANVQDLVTKGVDAIVCITANVDNAGNTAKVANDAKIPIFFVGGLPVETASNAGKFHYEGYSCDDYYGMGYVVGEYVADHNPGTKVVTLDGQYGMGAAELHAEGFQQALDDKNSGIKAVSIGTGGWARDQAIKVTGDLIASGRAFDVIFVMNEEMCAGTLQVFKEANIKDKGVVTCNAKEECWDWIKQGLVEATCPNPPTLNADLAFQQVVKYFKGEPFENTLKIYHTGGMLSKENIDQAMPWIPENYLAAKKAGKFNSDLSLYEQKQKDFLSKSNQTS